MQSLNMAKQKAAAKKASRINYVQLLQLNRAALEFSLSIPTTDTLSFIYPLYALLLFMMGAGFIAASGYLGWT